MNGMIVILGSPNDDNGNLSSIAMERCNKAIEEYKLHKDYKILLTGGYGEHFNRTSKPHAYYTKKYLISENIPEEKILEFAESSNTIADVKLSKQIIEKYNPEIIVVVTSDFHHDRVKWLFEKELPNREIALSCSKTNLPNEVLAQIKAHEIRALKKLKTVN
ncbi:MAG: YdcF family protein [Victivallales bacterium]|nr:YdcF family protein [Victivallales bacterium]MCF7889582.1 YdcF family protein [Victivallales bacterium]